MKKTIVAFMDKYPNISSAIYNHIASIVSEGQLNDWAIDNGYQSYEDYRTAESIDMQEWAKQEKAEQDIEYQDDLQNENNEQALVAKEFNKKMIIEQAEEETEEYFDVY